MNIFQKILKKKHKILIIADDGSGIRGVIAERSGICTDHSFPAGTELKKILGFGKEQHAGSVLFLHTAELRELDVKLGADLSSEERRSAIEYAAASDAGDHSGNQRISYMDGMFHDFRSGILASYFETDEIISLGKLIRNMKMKFLGVTNFKQLLLARHFSDQDHHGDPFLLFLGNHGIAAIPERNRLIIRNLPFGLPESCPEEEWKERFQRRLNSLFQNKRIFLYGPTDGQICSMLQEVTGAESIELMNWEDSVSNSILYFLRNSSGLIHPALPPPKEKDPKASGTFIGIFFLAVTLFSLGFLICRNCITKYILKQNIEINQQIIDSIKRESDQLQQLEKQLAEQQELFSVMKQKQRVSKNYLLVLNLLSRYRLRYSRITGINEQANGIHIEGESIWQPDLSRFFTHFEGELSKYQLSLFSDGLSKEKDGKIIFRSHIAPAGGNRK